MQTYPRVPRTHEDARRAPGYQASPRQGPGAPDCLNLIDHPRILQPPAPASPPPDCPDHTGRSTTGGTRPARCFSTRHRLLKPSEYELVFSGTGPGAYKSSGGGLTVRARKNGGDVPRLGLVISKKSIRLAVGRNRVKRLVRETFRLRQTKLGGLDVVVMSRAGVGDLPNPKLRAALDKHWETLERWKKS